MHYITPIENLPSIMTNGLLSHARAESIPHVSIADESVQDIRRDKVVPNGRPLHEYVNTYFDARNPMMYVRLGRKYKLAVIRIDSKILDIPGAIITDGNAASGATRFDPSPDGLALLNEDRVFAVSWNDQNLWDKMEKKRQRCAEVLVPDQVPCELVMSCYVCSADVAQACRKVAGDLEVVVNANVFFG